MTRMRDLLPFILPCCGLFWVVVGARQFLATVGKHRQPAARKETTSETAEASKTGTSDSPVRLWRRRLGGLFWFCAGVAIRWHSDIRFGLSPAVVSQSPAADDRLAVFGNEPGDPNMIAGEALPDREQQSGGKMDALGHR